MATCAGDAGKVLASSSVMWPHQQFHLAFLELLMRISKEKMSGKRCVSMRPMQTVILWAIIHPFLMGWSLHRPSTVEMWKRDYQCTEGFQEISKHPGGLSSPPVWSCRDLHSLDHLECGSHVQSWLCEEPSEKQTASTGLEDLR